MLAVALLPLLLALGICFVPVWLLRRIDRGRAQDDLISPQYTRQEVVRNASIAYALRMAAFGPLFVAGASGNLWPAIIGSASFGLGVYLIYILRTPLLDFVDDALTRDRSITVHEFIAREHGSDRRVRLLSASLTVFALLGLLIGEMIALAAFLEAILGSAALYAVVFGTLLLMVLHATVAGHSGVMHSSQLQLGMLYLGLFAATAILLYVHVSSLTPIPPHGTVAVVSVVIYCGAVLYYRRSRYVDTDKITIITSNAEKGRPPLPSRLLSRFEKILNVLISVFAGILVVVGMMQFWAAGLTRLVRDSVTALHGATGMPLVALIALCALPLLYPIVDVTNWQRLAALRKGPSPNGLELDRRSAALRRVFGMYAAESAFMLLFMCMLGAIAVIMIETPRSADVVQRFMAQLVSGENDVGIVALPLLLICLFVIALSTMSALFSASLCTIRYDILPALSQPSHETTARRYTLVAGGALVLAIAAIFCAANTVVQVAFTSTFVGVLFAICCAQLSFAPLVLGSIMDRTRVRGANISPGWALSIIGAGVASGAFTVMIYFATGNETWLWAAVPACIASGFMLYAIARIAIGRSAAST